MNVTDRERTVLVGILCDRERLAALDRAPWLRGPAHSARRIEIRKARQGFVRINLAGWLGRTPTASERVLYFRAYVSLDRKGLIVRAVSDYGTGQRTSRFIVN